MSRAFASTLGVVLWGVALAGCQAYSSNAGLVRSATSVAQDVVANTNDTTLAPIPGTLPSQAGNTTMAPPIAQTPNNVSVPGQPFTLRQALYEGGATAASGISITLWSTQLSCADYLANRVPTGASFVHIDLPPLTDGQGGTFSIVADADTPTAEQGYVYLNTPTPQSLGATQGSLSLSKVTLGTSIEGVLNATLEDGSVTALTFAGTAAAVFCSL